MSLLKPTGIVRTLSAVAWLSTGTSSCSDSEAPHSSGSAAVGGSSAASVLPKAGTPAAMPTQSARSTTTTMAPVSMAAAGRSGSSPTASAGSASAQPAAGKPNAGLGGAGAGTSAAGSSGSAGAAANGGASAAQGARPPATTLEYPTMMESITEAPFFNIYRPTNLDEPGRLLPVVAWANGGCVREESNWRPLFDRWAAAGIVTLALTTSPNGTLLASSDDDGGITIWDAYTGDYVKTLRRDRPYERMDITGIHGLTDAQKAILHTLGATDTT